MFSARSLVSGFIAGLLISSAPLSSYAAPSVFPARNPSYQTGNAPLDGLLAEYEKSIRAKGDSPRISAFVRESSGFKNRKISEGLRDEILKNRIESVSKNVLSQRLPANIASESVRKAVLSDLKGSFKKRNSADFRVFVRTSLSRADLEAALSAFGNAEMTFSFRTEDGRDVYEIAFPASGRYAKTLGVKLEKGEIPTALFEGVEIVEPFVVESLVSTGAYLSGEALSSLWGISKIGAQDYQYGLSLRPKVKVGVMDTGVALSHPDLSANISVNAGEIAGNRVDDDRNGYVDDVKGYNFVGGNSNAEDDHGHGTHIAGIIGARVNKTGVFGVDSNAAIVPLKVLSSNGYGSSYAIIDAINYAANNGIKVLNMSFGGNGTPSNDSICSAISAAKSRGVLSVVAAGNENADVSKKVPAGCVDALTVSAVDSASKKASFSNYGNKVDVAAPGVNIYSTYLRGRYAAMAGTSMAAPFVAGLAAAAFSASPNATPDQIRALLKDTANTVPVTSSVNIGRLVSMSKVMTALGVANDTLVGSGQTAPSTGTGTSGSGSTGSGTTGTGSNSGTGQTSPNSAPTLSIASSKTAPNTYVVSAMASDSDGTVIRYEYLNGTSLIASGSMTSVQVVVTANSTITVRVTDNSGASTSRSLSLTYQAPAANLPPAVTLTSQNVSSRYVQINLAASDSDGTVTSVQLSLNGRLVYSTTPNATRFAATLTLTRGYPVTVKLVAKDNKGVSVEKTIIVR